MAREIRCGVTELTRVLKDIVNDYGEEAQDEIAEAMKKTAKELVKQVKAKSPTRSGKYKKGWTSETKEGRLGTSTTIYNKNAYQLTHLLEFGHALYLGGRHVGEVGPIPHMAPVQDQAPDIFERKLREAMQ